MNEYLNEKIFIFPEAKITFKHKKIPLKLRTTFGTSHSSTTTRFNSFIQILVENYKNYNKIYGLGESGLPPKKPNVYLADSNDIKNYINIYFIKLEELIKLNFSEKIKCKYFNLNNIPQFIHTMFYALDNNPANKEEYSNCAKNCIESALLDLCSKIDNKPLYEFINLDPSNKKIHAFYTVSICDDSETLKSLEFGLKYTNYIKIKLNNDYNRNEHVMNLIYNYCKNINNYKGKWSIDLNSDFEDVNLCIKLVNEILLKYKEFIYMIEQPFPANIKDYKNINEWEKLKILCEKNDILIFADESISNYNSIEPLKNIISGINIKLEKCGGIRESLKCYEIAKKFNLKIWIGCMVGSSLLMNIAAVLTPISEFNDLDGDLLVDDKSHPCVNGFKWDKENDCIVLSKLNGIGVELKNEF